MCRKSGFFARACPFIKALFAGVVRLAGFFESVMSMYSGSCCCSYLCKGGFVGNHDQLEGFLWPVMSI